MSWFTLSPATDGPHHQHPPADVCTPPLDPRFFVPLAVLDLGFVDPALAGRKVLCVGRNIGACDEDFEVQEQSDGSWRLSKVDGMEPSTPSGVSKWAEPFEDGPGVIDSLPELTSAAMTEATHATTRGTLRICTEPRWVQSDDSPGGGYRFVARIDCWNLFGSTFVFYDPDTRSALHILQYT